MALVSARQIASKMTRNGRTPEEDWQAAALLTLGEWRAAQAASPFPNPKIRAITS